MTILFTGKTAPTGNARTSANNSNFGIIVGAVIASITVLVLFVVVFFMFWRKRRNEEFLKVTVN